MIKVDSIIENKVIEWRRHIHKNPELSFQEFKTRDFICSLLKEHHIEHKVIGETGVVALIGSGPKAVALRADIDALPIVEETNLEFSSLTPGIMHACGHDSHTAMLLGAAIVLKSIEASIPGVVKLIFQPGEEKSPGGASILIKEGVLENPKPLAIFGQHVNPDATVGIRESVAGPMMASADELYWTLKGFGAHAAQPHKGKDPIIAAAQLINHVQSIVSRQRNPLQPGVISITSIHGGSATNIIPEIVELKGTLRSFDNEWREWALITLEEHSRSICALHGVECEFTVVRGYPPLINNVELTQFANDVAQKVVGSNNCTEFEPKMWAEDFSFYGEHVPATFWMLGVRPQNLDSMPGLHNAKFAPDESAFKIGTELLVNTAIEFLKLK